MWIIQHARMSEPERQAAQARRALRSLRRTADKRQRRRSEAKETQGMTWQGPGTNDSAVLQWGPGLL